MPAKPVKVLPPIEQLHAVLDYNPDTGVLTWKHLTRESYPLGLCGDGRSRGVEFARNLWNGKRAGNVAGEADTQGRLYLRFRGDYYLAHRVIWALVHGDIPSDMVIDHINGDPADNRLCNLRLVSRSINQRNRRSAPGKTGHVGIYRDHNCYYARIGIGGRRTRNLGWFASLDDAVAARRAAEAELGYTERHGTG